MDIFFEKKWTSRNLVQFEMDYAKAGCVIVVLNWTRQSNFDMQTSYSNLRYQCIMGSELLNFV